MRFLVPPADLIGVFAGGIHVQFLGTYVKLSRQYQKHHIVLLLRCDFITFHDCRISCLPSYIHNDYHKLGKVYNESLAEDRCTRKLDFHYCFSWAGLSSNN